MDEHYAPSGADNLKLIIAAMFLIGICFTILGIVPVAILLFGLFISWRNGDISNVRITTRFIQSLLGVGAVVELVVAAYFQSEVSKDLTEGYFSSRAEVGRNIALFVTALCLVSAFMLEFLWYKPLVRQLDNFRSERGDRERGSQVTDGPSIMAREALAPYSTADELLKWSRLRDEGLVSEEEFAEARSKILSGA